MFRDNYFICVYLMLIDGGFLDRKTIENHRNDSL